VLGTAYERWRADVRKRRLVFEEWSCCRSANIRNAQRAQSINHAFILTESRLRPVWADTTHISANFWGLRILKWCCRFITCDGCVNCGARFRLPRRFPREKFGYRLRGAGPNAERATRATKGAFRTTPLSRVMSVMPFFEFVLVMVGVGTLAILLTALLLTATARLH
jgi:hypothetical protein